jgi:hypothetical protein
MTAMTNTGMTDADSFVARPFSFGPEPFDPWKIGALRADILCWRSMR